jgi:preprotein translocase subunit SecF
MNIVKHKTIYFLISLLVIIPGIVSLLLFGLKLSIDFSGGSRIAFLSSKTIAQQDVTKIRHYFSEQKVQIATLQNSGKELILRTPPLNQQKHNQVMKLINVNLPQLKEDSFETVGPTIGSETTTNAIEGVALASLAIVIYIALAFRQVPKPANSLMFGICAVIALLHDALVVLGIFSILGHFWGVEVDSLFVTAILTVIGFSVHDTIVVFDRIRENLKKTFTLPFDQLVNKSLLETMGRSLNTSLTVVLVLFTLLLFGGESIKWFVVALLIGVVSGTYSSIFNASLLLVVWQERSAKKKK